MPILCNNCGFMNKDFTAICKKCGEKVLSFIESKMIRIHGGTFWMGSTKFEDTVPVRNVSVSDFYIGKYPVTNKEYCLYDPSHENPSDNLPVVNVSWNDAVAYCKWLSEKTGKNYRLPTEAEWEYACRAGTKTDYYWGDEMKSSYCWYLKNSGRKVHPVGQKISNPWGLYDMSGNIYEWCSDWHGKYLPDSRNNPEGTEKGLFRINRGGSCNYDAIYCHSAYRFSGTPDEYHDFLGFRLARTQ